MGDPCSVPSESDFLDAFGIEPQQAKPEDGFWSYRFADGGGVVLLLSFDIHEGSLQTSLLIDDVVVSTIVTEGLERLWIDERSGQSTLRATFSNVGVATSANVEIEPRIVVRWQTLRR